MPNAGRMSRSYWPPIHVYTTLNVQHVESLNDVVAQITGVIVRETVPDSILERADEIELIDLPPDDLLQRLQEGKVYVPEQARRALEHFFRKGNLIALRELALRRTADRVDEQMQSTGAPRDHRDVAHDRASAGALAPARSRHGWCGDTTHGAAAGGVARRLCRDPGPPAAARGRPRARGAHAPPGRTTGSRDVTLSGQSVSEEILTYARTRNVSKIVVGKPLRPRWREVMFSVVDELARNTDDIDVYVISGEHDDSRPPSTRLEQRSDGSAYGWVLAVVAAVPRLTGCCSPSLRKRIWSWSTCWGSRSWPCAAGA